ncbi:MAG: hypothetical protein EA339_02460 [Rhodobacteraceae bacterium]|nr:MAG: hypothetical protein EA339_02460 [Paracoccaceae bacterium]
MPEVILNDLIFTRGGAITSDTPVGTSFGFDDDPDVTMLLEVRNGVTFTTSEDAFGNIVPVGSTTVLDGQIFTLSGVHEFWGTYTKIDPDTGETFTQQGQTVALSLTGEDGETINLLSPSDVFNITDPWRSGDIVNISVFSTPFDAGQITLTPGSDDNKLSFDKDVQIPCFVAGTLIDTSSGRKPVEDLQPGDLILTRDDGYMPLVWTGQRALDAEDLRAQPEFGSVILRAGALGVNMPECDTRVSPSHRVLICGPRAELLFGETEVLVPAIHLVGQPGIERDDSPVTYVHIMFDTHQIVLGDGMWSESFQPAAYSLDGLGTAQRDEILALFPELAKASGQGAFASARMTLKAHEARMLFAA